MAKAAVSAPPMHLGIKGPWTEEMQSDWTEFRAKQQRQAVDLILSFITSKIFLMLLLWRVFLDYVGLGFSLPRVLLGSPSTCMASLSILANLAGRSMIRSVHKLDVRIASALQILLLVILQAVNLLTACTMETELMQHRYYLTSQIVIFGIVWTAFCVPLWVHLIIGIPINFTSWLLFHRFVGFWQSYGFVKAATFGGCLCVLVPIIFIVKERVLWLQFRALCQMDRDREILEATQAAFRCVLSTQWGASCICDENGVISSSTPHLAELFGGGADLVGACLLDFAASDDESERLQKVLKNTTAVTSEQSFSLKFTAKSQGHAPNYAGFARRSVHHEVILYGIKLPPEAASGSNLCKNGGKSMFVGIKTSAQDVDMTQATFMALPPTYRSSHQRSLTEPKHVFDCSAQSESAAESTADVTDAASLLHGCTSVFSFDYAASQSISMKEGIRDGLNSTDEELCTRHEASTQTEEFCNAQAAKQAPLHLKPTRSCEGEVAEDELEKPAPRPAPVRLSLETLCPADESKAPVNPAIRESRPIKLEFAEVSALRSSAPLFVPMTASGDVHDLSQPNRMDEETKAQPLQEELPGSEDESLPMFGPVTLTLDSLCPSGPTALSTATLPTSCSSTDPRALHQSHHPEGGQSLPANTEICESWSYATASWTGSSARRIQKSSEEQNFEVGAASFDQYMGPGIASSINDSLVETSSEEDCAKDDVMSNILEEVDRHVFGYGSTSSGDSFSAEGENTPKHSIESLGFGVGSSDPAQKQSLCPDDHDSAPSMLEALPEMPNLIVNGETAYTDPAASSGPVRLSLDTLCAATDSEHLSQERYCAPLNTFGWQPWSGDPGFWTTPLSSSSGLPSTEHNLGPGDERLHLVSCRAASSPAHEFEESRGQGSQLLNLQLVDANQLWTRDRRPRSANTSSSVTSGSSSDETLSRSACIPAPDDSNAVAYLPGRSLRQEPSRLEALVRLAKRAPDSRDEPTAACHQREDILRSSNNSSGSSWDRSSCSSMSEY